MSPDQGGEPDNTARNESRARIGRPRLAAAFHQATMVALTILVTLLLAGCRPDSSNPALLAEATSNAWTNYAVTGVVRELKMDGHTLVIAHQEIPGYMEAMTMPFTLRQREQGADLSIGDTIAFNLLVSSNDSYIDAVRRLRAAGPLPPAPNPSTRPVRDVEPLQVGDQMPDYAFTNELSRGVRLKDYHGKAVALTFLFTRCPQPEFCPRMSMHFARAAQELKPKPELAGRWQLLSLSFDVAADTPAVLLQYAKRYGYDPAHWSFLTGALIDVDAITEQFGLYFVREQGAINFDHNLRTVVIDPQGRIHKLYVGNTWTPAELVADLVQLAGAAPSPTQ